MLHSMKVLFTSHVANFSKFNYSLLKFFYETGHEVHYASMGEEEIVGKEFCKKVFTVPIARSPFSPKNLKAIIELKKIIETEKYDLIHTHSPMGSVDTRIAASKARKKGCKVFYTAHGFHFFKGAPKINWILYYTIEKLLSSKADCILTINDEDYKTAIEKKFRCAIRKIPGVGYNENRFIRYTDEKKSQLRQDFGYSKDDFILVCVAEFTKNKNQILLIKAIDKLKLEIPQIKLVLAGRGACLDECKEYTKNHNLENEVTFLGYRRDVEDLYNMSDILVTASFREGLAVNIMEAEACGLPIICSNTRGQRDLVTDRENGLIYEPDNLDEYINKVIELYKNSDLFKHISENNIINAKKYTSAVALNVTKGIYEEFITL